MKIKILKSKGFTLIELMLVVTIILILMSFLIPKFSSYQNKARSTKAINTAKQIQTAVMASYGDQDGKFDIEDIKKDIGDLTSVEKLTDVKQVGEGQQCIEVQYESDNKPYTVNINAADNTCTVSNGKDQIYPKQKSIETTVD